MTEPLLRQVQQQRWQPCRKEEKYVDLGARYIFEPIAIEILGIFNASACHLLDDLGKRTSEKSGKARLDSAVFYVSANTV